MAKDLPVSPLAVPMPALPAVAGVRLGTVAAGIRYKGRDDLMMMVFAPGTTAAGVFTKSKCPGAPVDWCRKALAGGTARAVVVNAGNANVFTGRAGEEAARLSAEAAAKLVGCAPSEVFLASTGVIGEVLPHEKLTAALPALHDGLSPEAWAEAARGIMTTDTFPKAVTRQASIGGAPVTITGIAKGSGMIAPDMATMLCFVATDAKIPAAALQSALKAGVETSFNCTTVDSDTSTSDTVLLFATGQAEHPEVPSEGGEILAGFREALAGLLHELALQVVRDGEGAQKLIQVAVRGAVSDVSAKVVALAIANSPLVKTAIAGEDANWGRVVMAVGKAGEPAERDLLTIRFGDIRVAHQGERDPAYDEATTSAYMKQEEITISVDIGLGEGRARVWTCDLTEGYIAINADYRS